MKMISVFIGNLSGKLRIATYEKEIEKKRGRDRSYGNNTLLMLMTDFLHLKFNFQAMTNVELMLV